MSAMTTAPALNRMPKPAKLIPLVVAPGFKKIFTENYCVENSN